MLYQNLAKSNAGSTSGVPIGGQISEGTTSVSRKTARNFIFGDTLAPNVLIVFSRYNCDYCRYFYNTVMDSLYAPYIQTGKLKIISKDLVSPADKTGMLMAKVAEVGRQTGHFPEIHALFFKQIAEPDSMAVIRLALQAGITEKDLKERLNSPETISKIDIDNAAARSLNFSGTPSFILNKFTHPGFMSFKDITSKIVMPDTKGEKCDQ